MPTGYNNNNNNLNWIISDDKRQAASLWHTGVGHSRSTGCAFNSILFALEALGYRLNNCRKQKRFGLQNLRLNFTVQIVNFPVKFECVCVQGCVCDYLIFSSAHTWKTWLPQFVALVWKLASNLIWLRINKHATRPTVTNWQKCVHNVHTLIYIYALIHM